MSIDLKAARDYLNSPEGRALSDEAAKDPAGYGVFLAGLMLSFREPASPPIPSTFWQRFIERIK